MEPRFAEAASRESCGAREASGDVQNAVFYKAETPPQQMETYLKKNSSALTAGSNNIGTQLRQKERHAIPIAVAWNTNNSHEKQYLQANVDTGKVVDSVYQCIVQSYKTPEALQDAVVSNWDNLLDTIANTLIVEMTHHLQPLLPGSESADNIVEEALKDIALHHSQSSCGRSDQLPFSSLYSASFLEDVISELLFKIVLTSNILVPKDQKIPKCDLSKTAIRIIPFLVIEMNKSRIKVIKMKGKICENDVDRVVDSVYDNCFKLYGSCETVQKELKSSCDTFGKKIASLLIVEMEHFQIEPSCAHKLPPHMYSAIEPRNIIYKVQNLFQLRNQDRPSSPTTTVLSSKVLEEIIQCLMTKILPPPPNVKKCAENQRYLSDSELKEMASKFVQEVMIKISGHEIWYTKDATFIQRVHVPGQKDIQNVDDSSYTYETPLIVPDDVSPVCKDKIKTTSRLLFREISNPNFMAFQTDDSLSGSYSTSSESSCAEQISSDNEVCEEPGGSVCNSYVYSSSFLEEIIAGVSCKIFNTISDQLRKESGKNRAEGQPSNMTTVFVDLLLTEIKKAKIRVINVCQDKYRFPDILKHAVDSITNLVFSNIYQEYENDSAMYTGLTNSSCTFAKKVVCYILEAISEYHFQCPVSDGMSRNALTAIDANNILPKVAMCFTDTCKRVKSAESASRIPSATSMKAASFFETVFHNIQHPYDESELFKKLTVLSSTVVEEVVAQFLSKLFFNCPDLTMSTTDTSSACQMKKITEKLTNALCISISENNIQICQDGTRFLHPKDRDVIEKVINAVYNNVYQLSKSHMSIYQNLAKDGNVLSHTIASLMVSEICNYNFQPCPPRGKVVDQCFGVESSYIMQQVFNNIGPPPPLGPTKQSSSHGVYAPFLEEIVSQFLTKMFLCSSYDQTQRTKSNSLEAELSKVASRLINSVLKELLKSEINVIKPADDAPSLHSEDEDFIAVVVDSLYINALHESGSPLKLFKSLISGCTVVSERIASMVIKEMSKYQLQSFLAAGVACESYTDSEVALIVEKVLSDVSAQASISCNAESLVCSITDKFAKSVKSVEYVDNLPTIIPYLNNCPMQMDTAIAAMHLAVLSIKTKPLEVLENQSILLTGQSLESLRKATIAGKCTPDPNCNAERLSPSSEEENGSQRRAFLDMCGRLAVKPKKLISRNSFLNILKPDITKVELLKDVKTNHELIIRLIAHDISYQEEEEGVEELVLCEDSCVFEEKTIAVSKKKVCWCCRCCGSIKTKNTLARRPSFDEHNACTFDKNPKALTCKADSTRGRMPCISEGLQFTNTGNNRNSNANRAMSAFNNQWNNNIRSSASNSFQAGSTLQNYLFQSANTPFAQYRKTRTRSRSSVSVLFQPYPLSSHIINRPRPSVRRRALRYPRIDIGSKSVTGCHKRNKDFEEPRDGMLHLPPVSSSSPSLVSQMKTLSLIPGMTVSWSRLFSQKSAGSISKKDGHI